MINKKKKKKAQTDIFQLWHLNIEEVEVIVQKKKKKKS